MRRTGFPTNVHVLGCRHALRRMWPTICLMPKHDEKHTTHGGHCLDQTQRTFNDDGNSFRESNITNSAQLQQTTGTVMSIVPGKWIHGCLPKIVLPRVVSLRACRPHTNQPNRESNISVTTRVPTECLCNLFAVSIKSTTYLQSPNYGQYSPIGPPIHLLNKRAQRSPQTFKPFASQNFKRPIDVEFLPVMHAHSRLDDELIVQRAL